MKEVAVILLAGVLALGQHADSRLISENVALRGRASQSSQYNHLTHAKNAIDGGHETYESRSCTQTELQADPWWRVDLLHEFRVTSVTITNRGDCCPERLDGAEIRIGNSMENNGNNNPVCAVVSTIPAGESATFECREMEGRYVNIIRSGCYKFLTLCEVEVNTTQTVSEHIVMDPVTNDGDMLRASQCSVRVPENAASGGKATQSSTGYGGGGGAKRAIDRNRNPAYKNGFCSHTRAETDPWWRLDLLRKHRVTSVTITDCCPKRCAVVSTIPVGESVTFQCHEMEGRYVNIIRPGCYKILTLCEVEVNGSTVSEDIEMDPVTNDGDIFRASQCPVTVPDNAASGGKATQSSTAYSGGAERAIDGNRNPGYTYGSCTHTEASTDPWWRVDLLREHRVTSVTITNREDCCSERLDGAEIRIGNSMENNGNNNPVCAVVSTIPAGDSVTFQCHEMEGRYVNIIQPGCYKSLTLCEVEVNATQTGRSFHHRGARTDRRRDREAQVRRGGGARRPEVAERRGLAEDIEMDPVTNDGYIVRASQCSVTVPDNAASGGKATQSSTAYGGGAERAIDRNRNPLYEYGSCTHTEGETDPWWRVDLHRKHRVTSVTITNRGDCCSERLDGAEVRIGNSMENNGNNNPVCAVVSTIPAGESVTFQCHEMEGRYVNVILPGCYKILTLCEVEVNASTVSEHIVMVPVTNDGDRFRASQCSVTVPDNAASGGKATQSSTAIGGSARRAIDRNRNPVYRRESCSHTRAETDPWWRVDLLREHRVTSVAITNRGDCCSERIIGTEIRIGNSLENNGNNNPVCAVISQEEGESFTFTFQCHGMEGRYVNLFNPGREKNLILCEVEVNGSAVPDGFVDSGVPTSQPDRVNQTIATLSD
ncbi:hypothetical protein AAFF_G00403660 [Aldrovandia affinis]|uniref:Fucolectin tachylectin-4 pentraxin-1 domain-containing protein n=1 Tax=Aldrovandia affinis TaxID=143900 RepID=A0AAD7T7D9_9TELE|nr:hypothetical protein AAFF_G00403660 [Aldrovandia affinis]